MVMRTWLHNCACGCDRQTSRLCRVCPGGKSPMLCSVCSTVSLSLSSVPYIILETLHFVSVCLFVYLWLYHNPLHLDCVQVHQYITMIVLVSSKAGFLIVKKEAASALPYLARAWSCMYTYNPWGRECRGRASSKALYMSMHSTLKVWYTQVHTLYGKYCNIPLNVVPLEKCLLLVMEPFNSGTPLSLWGSTDTGCGYSKAPGLNVQWYVCTGVWQEYVEYVSFAKKCPTRGDSMWME